MTIHIDFDTGLNYRLVKCDKCGAEVRAFHYIGASGAFYERHKYKGSGRKDCLASMCDLPPPTLADCNAALDRILKELEP